jgi:Protein of unknown function (DUF2442)
LFLNIKKLQGEHGMNTSVNNFTTMSSVAINVKVNDSFITLDMEDGRIISIPLYYFEELEKAEKKQRENVEIFYNGKGLIWKELDIQLSIPRLLGINED